MRRSKKIGLDFEVDKLTNSIENVVTGDSFSTDITLITAADLKTVTKKNGWQFDWKFEFKQPERDVYKLTIVNNQTILQGHGEIPLRKYYQVNITVEKPVVY